MVSIVKLTELTGIIEEKAKKGRQRSVSRPKYLALNLIPTFRTVSNR
jgi:hypothetical protein